MKNRIIVLTILGILLAHVSLAQGVTPKLNYWQIGVGLGELPIGGSFKPSISFGYNFRDNLYVGFIYQFSDEISRNESSFNANFSELDGLLSSSEEVAQRFLFQVRYTPIKNGPYLSGGFVFNGRDMEAMKFDNRVRQIFDKSYSGTIEIQQTRLAGWGLALGLGYQYNFKNGFSVGFEWTPAWGQYPSPFYEFDGTAKLPFEAQAHLKKRMDDGFKSSVTNMYKVFHIGVAYRFQ